MLAWVFAVLRPLSKVLDLIGCSGSNWIWPLPRTTLFRSSAAFAGRSSRLRLAFVVVVVGERAGSVDRGGSPGLLRALQFVVLLGTCRSGQCRSLPPWLRLSRGPFLGRGGRRRLARGSRDIHVCASSSFCKTLACPICRVFRPRPFGLPSPRPSSAVQSASFVSVVVRFRSASRFALPPQNSRCLQGEALMIALGECGRRRRLCIGARNGVVIGGTL